MKCIITILGVLLAILFTVVLISDVRSWHKASLDDLKTLASNSVLIVYAPVKRNALGSAFVVQEVWKDEQKTNCPLFVGMKLSDLKTNQISPDGEIVFFESLSSRDPRTYVFIYNGSVTFETNGQVTKMTLEQYKKSCGLQ